MALKSISGLGFGGKGLRDDLPAALAQLQAIKQVIVTGAAADTNIAITGLLATSHIIAVQNLTDLATVTEAATVAAGNIKFPTTDTSTKKLLVTYFL